MPLARRGGVGLWRALQVGPMAGKFRMPFVLVPQQSTSMPSLDDLGCWCLGWALGI